MSYFKENHSIKKIMKNDNITNTLTTYVSGMGANYADEILWGSGLACPNKIKGYFMFQGGCRMTSINTADVNQVRVTPYFSSDQTTTNIKNMQSGASAIAENTNANPLEPYSSLATSFSESIDFTNSSISLLGSVSKKATGTPELWLLPIGENK